jgi:hypothetical protein
MSGAKKRALRRAALLACVGPCLLNADSVAGATMTAFWVGGESGLWGIGSNWSTGAYPDNATDVYDVVLSTGSTAHTVMLKGTNPSVGPGSFGIHGLALNLPGDTLDYIDASALYVPNGTITGSGRIVFDASGSLGGSNMTIGPAISVMTGAGDATIGSAGYAFTNQGTISSTNSKVITIVGNWTNQGTISTNGPLFLGGNFSSDAMGTILNNGGSVNVNGTISNVGKTLTVTDSIGNLQLSSGTISGGRVERSGSASLTASYGSRFDNVTLAAPLLLSGNLTVTNGLTLDNGTITIASGDQAEAELIFSGTQTLGGTGSILMQNAGSIGLDTLTVGKGVSIASNSGSSMSGQSITNHGAISHGAAGLDWQMMVQNFSTDGTISCSAGRLELNAFSPASGAYVTTNSGTIVANGGRVGIGQTVINSGTMLANAGSLDLFGIVTNLGTLSATNGTISLSDSWSNSGTINLDHSLLALSGSFTTAQLGTINSAAGTVDIRGTLVNTSATLSHSGGTVHLNNGTIIGGRIEADANTAVVLSAGTLDSVTLAGPIVKDGASNITTRFANSVTLDNASVSFVGTGATSTLSVSNATGTGTFEFDGTGGNLQIVAAGGSMNFGSGITVCTGTASGTLGDNGGTLNNAGTIMARNGATLTVGASLHNTGTLHAASGGFLTASFMKDSLATLIVEPTSSASFAGGVYTIDKDITTSASAINFAGTFNNAAKIDMTAGSLTLGGSWSNSGAVHVSGGGTLTLAGSSGNIGSVTVSDSRIRIAGSYTTAQLLSINQTNVTLSLSGGNLDNTGQTLALDATTGSMPLEGGTILNGTISATGGAMLNATTGVSALDATVLNADLNIGSTATVNLRGGGFANHGVISLNAGTLGIGGGAASISLAQLGSISFNGGTVSVVGTLNNTGQTLLIGASPIWGINGGTVFGGVVQPAPGVALAIRSGTLSSTTLDGQAQVPPAAFGNTMTAAGTLTFTAGSALSVASGTSSSGVTTLRLSDATLAGPGQVVFPGPGSLTALITGFNGTGTIGSGMTVRTAGGGGTIGVVSGTLKNFGTISSQTSGAGLVFAGTFTNNGTVEARNGGTVNVSNSIVTNFAGGVLTGGAWDAFAGSTLNFGGSTITTNHADIRLDGMGSTFNAVNSLASNQGSFTISGGRNFTTAGTLNNSGTVTIGPASTFTVNGALTNSGRINLDSSLAVKYSGASPIGVLVGQIGTQIISPAAQTDPRRGIGYSDDPAAHVALLRTTWLGDADLDGIVSTADFVRLGAHFGNGSESWSDGDFNADGVINALDFNALATNFGLTGATASLGSVVPEPCLALPAAVALFPRRHRRRAGRRNGG